MTFEENLAKLEALSNDIKRTDISLEDALKDFEEGIKLAKSLEKELDAMEGKIQILMNSPAAEEEESAPKKTRRTSSKAAPSLELFNESTEITGTRS